MDDRTSPEPGLSGDFAAGERKDALSVEEKVEAELQGDFAAGERTEAATSEEVLEADLHGDYAAGERTEPLTPQDDAAGTFADTTDESPPA